MAPTARCRMTCRVAVAVATAASAVLIAARGESVVLGWATRLARTGAPHERRAAIAKLEELRDPGATALIGLSHDRTPMPLAGGGGKYAPLLPRDTVGDLALDSLRRMRLGGPAPRAFEWNIQSGVSFQTAFEEWRRAETDAAIEWLEAKRTASGRLTDGQGQ